MKKVVRIHRPLKPDFLSESSLNLNVSNQITIVSTTYFKSVRYIAFFEASVYQNTPDCKNVVFLVIVEVRWCELLTFAYRDTHYSDRIRLCLCVNLNRIYEN